MNHTQLSSSESKGENRSVTAHWPKVPIIPKESQTATGWKGSLEAISRSNTPVQAGPPRSSCLGPHPNKWLWNTSKDGDSTPSLGKWVSCWSPSQPFRWTAPACNNAWGYSSLHFLCWNTWSFCQPLSPDPWGVSGWQHNPLVCHPPYQICATSKVAEGALCTIIQITNEDV